MLHTGLPTPGVEASRLQEINKLRARRDQHYGAAQPPNLYRNYRYGNRNFNPEPVGHPDIPRASNPSVPTSFTRMGSRGHAIGTGQPPMPNSPMGASWPATDLLEETEKTFDHDLLDKISHDRSIYVSEEPSTELLSESGTTTPDIVSDSQDVNPRHIHEISTGDSSSLGDKFPANNKHLITADTTALPHNSHDDNYTPGSHSTPAPTTNLPFKRLDLTTTTLRFPINIRPLSPDNTSLEHHSTEEPFSVNGLTRIASPDQGHSVDSGHTSLDRDSMSPGDGDRQVDTILGPMTAQGASFVLYLLLIVSGVLLVSLVVLAAVWARAKIKIRTLDKQIRRACLSGLDHNP